MKAQEAQALLANLCNDAARACSIAKAAAKNKKSVRGDGRYGHRFHAVSVSLSTTEGKLRSALSGLDLDPCDVKTFDSSLSVLKSPDAEPTERPGALKALQLICQSVVLPKIERMTASPVPATEQVLPMSVVLRTRSYIEKVVVQANGTYEHQWYDACSVMIRRIAETLIIEVYEAKGEADEIKKDGNFLMLSGLIDRIQTKTNWNLQRETKNALPLLKNLGDRSAHNRRYLATKQDVDKVVPGLRVLVEDLLHLAGLK